MFRLRIVYRIPDLAAPHSQLPPRGLHAVRRGGGGGRRDGCCGEEEAAADPVLKDAEDHRVEQPTADGTPDHLSRLAQKLGVSPANLVNQSRC